MANIYVRSTDGANTDNGSTWALAKLDLVGAGAGDAAGDSIWVSQSHNESTAGSINPAWAGTLTAPTKVICADDTSGEPPTAYATSAVVATTGATNINLTTAAVYYYGITFQCATGTSNQTLAVGTGATSNRRVVCEKCNFQMVATGTSGAVSLNNVTLYDCGFRLADAAQRVTITNTTWIYGGSVQAGGTSPTFVFNIVAGTLFVEGFDFSNCGTTVDLLAANAATVPVQAQIRNCKLPASWSGNLVNNVATLHAESVFEMINCSSSSANYNYWRQTLFGSIRDEETVVLAASDGVTTISWKLVSVAAMGYPNGTLKTQDILVYNSATGSAKTATVEVVTDNVTLKDDECWLEVMYLGDASFPITTRITDRRALAAAANQTSSSAAWTTTGLATPVKQKLSVTFTPQLAGFVIARVYLAKPSTTVYVDPVATLT